MSKNKSKREWNEHDCQAESEAKALGKKKPDKRLRTQDDYNRTEFEKLFR